LLLLEPAFVPVFIQALGALSQRNPLGDVKSTLNISSRYSIGGKGFGFIAW